MRSPGRLDDSDTGLADDEPVSDQSLSDASVQRLLRLVLLVLVTAVVTGLFAAAAIWALGADDEPPAPMSTAFIGAGGSSSASGSCRTCSITTTRRW